MTETSKKNNKTLENLIKKLLEIMNDRGIIASHVSSPLSKIINPEHTSQFKLVKDPTSDKLNDLVIDKTTTVTV